MTDKSAGTDTEERLKAAIEKYADTMKRVSLMYVKNPADTEDIMQEVFLKYILHGEKFKSEEHEKSWIVLVTVNQCKDHLKSYWIRNVSAIGERDFAVPEDDGGDVLECVRALPANYRLPIYLFYYENYSVVEISRITGVNINTVYSRLYRARTLLKKSLGGRI